MNLVLVQIERNGQIIKFHIRTNYKKKRGIGVAASCKNNFFSRLKFRVIEVIDICVIF